MSTYNAPLPHDQQAEDLEFRKAFAHAMVKGNQLSPPFQPTVETLAVPAVALVENPPTLQTFESWVETVGDLYRSHTSIDCVEFSPHVAQILNARSLLDEYRAFASVCES